MADIKEAMFSRDRARRKWKVSGDSASHEAFKKLRNHTQELVRTSKKPKDNIIRLRSVWYKIQTLSAADWVTQAW